MNDPTKPPLCPQCSHHSFIKLEPKKGGGFTLLTIFAFAIDLFTPGLTKSPGMEAMNQRRPGWKCENCGWEIRVKTKK
jgi:DNA-directed RNA polymerase subunit RPC12/RpoP